MKKSQKRKSGQAMVEYIIIVGVIAVVAITVFGIFGDAIREKVFGATDAISARKSSDAQAEANRSGSEELRDLGGK